MGAIQLDLGKKGMEVWLETVAAEGGSHMGYTGDAESSKSAKKIAPDHVAAAIRSFADGLSLQLEGAKSPDELRLDFGMSLDPSSRVVFGQSGTFRVSMLWKKPA